MDRKTLIAYDTAAEIFAREWHEQPPPVDLHGLIKAFFRPGPTADIGCGSGREVAWLCANGFPAIGYDASEGLLAKARELYPALNFQRDALPQLAGISENAFDNVLCETVIMHLEHELVAPSVKRLMAITKPYGTLYLSWRVTEGADRRDEQGRLYAAFDKEIVVRALSNGSFLLDEEVISASSGKKVHRIIVRKEVDAT